MANPGNITPIRGTLPGALMIFSIVLLIILQVLWLTASWREVRENFRKETNSLFRRTILAMQDSIVFKNTTPVETDTLFTSQRISPYDSVDLSSDHNLLIDRIKRKDTVSVVEVFIVNNKSDSLAHLLPPIARRMRMDRTNRKFIIHLGPDSLNLDSIQVKFGKALLSAGLPVDFKVFELRKTRLGRTLDPPSPGGMLVSDVVPFNPATHYAVQFISVDHVFWKAITPQILFCVFLTVLTAGSFYSMNRNMRSQRRLMQMKNDFISNMSHELKTPVSTVTVAIEALERFKGLDDPEKTSEYLTMAKSELQRLTLMVDRILQTASSGEREPAKQKVIMNMDQKISDILDSLKLLFDKRGIDRRYERRGVDFSLNGDPQQLTTLVYNLIDNAIKYTRDAPVISVMLEDLGDSLAFSVRDNGVGIPEQYHKKVFEKFFRVPAGDVHDVRGYGLGLSYVASVVEQHHGSIALESMPGKGTCFIVRLPKNSDR